MEKKIVLITIIIIAAFTSCTVSKAPKYKQYVMKEKFVNIKGVNVPELTPERKVFNPSKELKRDMKNSLLRSQVIEIYGNNDNAYWEARKNHLIKVTNVNTESYNYEYVTYDQTYLKPKDKYDVVRYAYSGDNILKYIEEIKMQVLPLDDNIYTGNSEYSEFTDEALVEYTCWFSYYPDGTISHYSCNINKARVGSMYLIFRGVSIGAEDGFDENGDLSMSVNHEDGFKMDFATIISIILKGRKELIDNDDTVYNVAILDIIRNKNKLGDFWIVPYRLGEKRLLHRIIDGKTGLVIDEFENNEEMYQKYTEKDKEQQEKIDELRKVFIKD
ncbi:hypothetical protein FUA48_14085 [Flavobacterium alkalisoli]|uniref:Lipoprotein n=1 Tax=Flavobacterium alkalisoli TaxID=2602769 RepID=A0A5B9FXK2_9FLAO|nr:hypothetical protein [Flavobacterium alkalisoli]QEE50666.1 hypothetical protein FUA48_14085 [Flavobacterium alkalisoli]